MKSVSPPLVHGSPDYNQVFRRMNGRLFPVGWLTFLLYRNRIDAGRALVMFVVPEYRFRGVPAAMFSKLFAWGRTHGSCLLYTSPSPRD